MTDICKIFSAMISDEKQADKEYSKLENAVHKEDKWKIRQIKSEEKTHKEELIAMANRYKCNV